MPRFAISAALAELVDAPDLGSGSERSESSSLLCRTTDLRVRLFKNQSVMKHVFLFPLALFSTACVLIGCMREAQSSPEIRLGTRMFRTTPEGVDTLSLTDTVSVGDTMRLNFVLNGGFNALMSFRAQPNEPSAMNLAIEVDSVVQKQLAQGSDLENALMIFKQEDNIVLCSATLRFVPLKAGIQPVTMSVSNTAGTDYSPSTYTFVPIVK